MPTQTYSMVSEYTSMHSLSELVVSLRDSLGSIRRLK